MNGSWSTFSLDGATLSLVVNGEDDLVNVTGADNTVNIATTDGSAGVISTVNIGSGTVNVQASSHVSVVGNNNTVNGVAGDAIEIHGTNVTVNASNATIYEGNTSTVTVNGTGNTIVHLGVAPIMLDLGDDGLELTAVANSAIVTAASDGAMTRLGWVGPTNGILVTDRNGDGQFGDVSDISFIEDSPGAQTDLEGLAAWDTNDDGMVSALDAGWSKLKIWVDANMDAASSDGEVKTLEEMGITSIGLQRTLTGADGSITSDSFASATSTFTRADGTTGTSYDVTLGQEILTNGGWNAELGMNTPLLTGSGQLGHLVANAGDSDIPTATDISYTAANTIDPTLLAIWGDFLDPVRNAARKAALASGQIGDTSWMQQNGVTVEDPNRGARMKTQRMQVLDLDLRGAGPDVTEAGGHTVAIDVNQTGKPMNTAWVGSSDGILVVDAVGDGDIDAATEATFQNWVPYARTSLQGLSAFDTSKDGAIDAEDQVFNALRIWTDANGDGVSQSGELQTLTDVGVRSISLTPDSEAIDTKTLGESQILASATVTMRDGTTHSLYDIALGIDDPDAAATSGDTASSSAAVPSASQQLASAIDMTTPRVVAEGMAQNLTGSLEASDSSIGQNHGSDGPAGDGLNADETDSDGTVEGWWQSAGNSLSDTINAFNGTSNANDGDIQAPVASANDAAMIQRHLLLRQAIAGFTAESAAPAIFARQGRLDTQATLAAATRSATAQASNTITKAA